MDTLQTAKALQGAGFDQTQAEALVHAIGHALENNVASKTDVLELGIELRGEIGEVRGEIEKVRGEVAKTHTEIERLRAEMYRAMAFQTIAIVGAVVALLKLF